MDDLTIAAFIVTLHEALRWAAVTCPSFRLQIIQLIRNKTEVLEKSKTNSCLNLGKPGYIRAHYPERRQHYAMDYQKR